jgi:hypothetical protein
MSKLVIYNENSRRLSPLSFINDIQNQTKIRDIDTESMEFRQELGMFFTKINNLIGIKDALLDINKLDIKEMILMRFKGLSLNEIDYAFKMERYGEFGKRIEHFQLFNAEYVGSVIDRYCAWKEFKKKNNISTVKIQESISSDQKTKIENDIVVRFIKSYLISKTVDEEYFYVYDILDKRGLMNKDLDYKNSVKADAIYILKQEYNAKKAGSADEFKQIKSTLKTIESGLGGGIKQKCKILALEEFFRNLCKDENKLKEFKLKF